MRPGGYQRWSEVFPAEPGIWTHGRLDLTDVVDGELLDGVMHITGHLPGGFEPFETRMRVEFYDETDGRTRLEIRQWLPEQYVSPSKGGWGEALTKLDAVLAAHRNPLTVKRAAAKMPAHTSRNRGQPSSDSEFRNDAERVPGVSRFARPAR